MSSSSSSEYVRTETFNTAMTFITGSIKEIKEAVREIEKCNRDQDHRFAEFMNMVQPLLDDYKTRLEANKEAVIVRRQRFWDLKIAVFGSVLATASSLGTAGIMYALGLAS